MRSILILLVGIACTFAFRPDIAGAQGTPPTPKSQIAGDKKKAEHLILAHFAYNLLEKNDSSLVHAATHIGMAKDAASVTRIFQEAMTKGNAVPFLGRDDTVRAIKLGLKYSGRDKTGALSDAADVANTFITKIESMGNRSIKIEDFRKEAAVMALYGNFSILSEPVREAVVRELAKMSGRSFDEYVAQIREHRILSTPANDSSKGLDRRTYEKGIALIEKQLKLSREQIADKNRRDDAERRREELEKDVKHYEAALYLTSVGLTPLLGEKDASRVTAAGTSFIKMYETMKVYGPGGVSADKLLMCSNMVGAGMMLLQAFSDQQDPTLAALRKIMQELEVIQRQLEEIEAKIDNLSHMVLVGFERVLDGVQSNKNFLEDFAHAMSQYTGDQTQLQAIQTLQNYLATDAVLFQQDLKCSGVLAENLGVPRELKSCLEGLAVKLARHTVFGTNPRNVTTPIILTPLITNLTLSIDQARFNNATQVDLAELSSTLYFLASPSHYMRVIARNHEATSAYTIRKLALDRLQTVPNPEALAASARTYIDTVSTTPVLRQNFARDLTQEILDRFQEVETFVRSVPGSERTLEKLSDKLSAQLDAYVTVVKTASNEVLKRPYSELRRRFLEAPMLACGSDDKSTALKVPPSLDGMIDDVFWVAQEMEFGEIQSCYEQQVVATKKIGNYAFNRLDFTVKVYFQPKPAVDPLRLSQADQQGVGRKRVGDKGALLLSARSISSKQEYTNHNNYARNIRNGAWYGLQHYASETRACTEALERKPRFRSIPECSKFDDKVIERFARESQESVSIEDKKAGIAGTRTVISGALSEIVFARSRVWDPLTLRPIAATAPSILSGYQLQKTRELEAAMAEYTRLHLLTMNILLTGFYHGATVSKCADVLNEFDPATMARTVALDVAHDGGNGYGRKLKASFAAVLGDCLVPQGLSPDLLHLQSELQTILKLQN